MSQYDSETIDLLKRSIEQLGQIYSVIIDSDGEVLAGRHRLKAGATKKTTVDTGRIAERLGVSRKMAKLMIILHSNVQRKVSREETRELILEMAKELEAQGVPKEKIASELYKKYVPYSERYIRELLPDEYKQIDKRNKDERLPIEEVEGSPEDFTYVNAELVPHLQTSNEDAEEYESTYWLHEIPEEERPTMEQIERIKRLYREVHSYEPDQEFLDALDRRAADEVIRQLEEEKRLFRTEESIRQQIHSPVSRVDVEVPMKLSELGVTGFTTQEPVCVYQLVPDLMFPDKRIMIFFDGPGHKHTDLELDMRNAMRRRGWKVIELEYERYSKETVRQLTQRILEILGIDKEVTA